MDEGLEQSRVLLLCISPTALASGWVALERSTAVHRDPANAGRRFIPLLLGDGALPDTLRRYKYVDFREEAEAAFAEVLASCRPDTINEPGHPARLPVLSLHSLPTRPAAIIPIKGRERELKWLFECATDALVSGQPGSGKTELLQSGAGESHARFLITDNQDEAVAALLASCPPIVVVDDAGTKRDLLIRLRHLRTERGLSFRIVAICWPFDKTLLQQALNVNETETMELDGLPRKIIAEIIADIATAKGVRVSDEFIRVVAKQARGMPGLAAALSLATIAATGDALISGELLLRDLTPLLLHAAGPLTIHLLGAFACGGSKGISFAAVARNLGREILQVKVEAERVALAGVLEQTDKESLSVQPEFLRSALIKETFFPVNGLALPWEICHALINSAQDPILGYLELIHARGRAGAAVSIDLLREITLQANDSRLWDSMAALDRSNCEWAVESAPALSTVIKRAALHYIPARIIPILLVAAAGDTRPLNAFPEADLRLLEDRINASWSDAVERRRMLFDAALSWLRLGGDARIGYSAIRLSFGLNYHETDSDPADPHTIRLRDALLPLDAAIAVFDQWGIMLRELSAMEKVRWSEVTVTVDNWFHSDTRRGSGLSDDYATFLLSSTIQMVADLLSLAHDNQAALRWIYYRSESLGMLIEPCPVVPEFLILFPKERLDGDWEENERKQTAAAQALAVGWEDRPIKEIVLDLSNWERQVEEFGRVWPQMTSVFTTKLAQSRVVGSDDLMFVIRNLSSRTAGPLIEAAISQGRMAPEHFSVALEQPDIRGILIHCTLTGKTPSLYVALQPYMPRWEPLVESLCLRGEVAEEMLERLLQHEDNHLRREVGLHMFRAKRGIPPLLTTLWRDVIVKSIIKFARGHDANHPYDLDRILAFDPSIAPTVLNSVLEPGSQMGYFTSGLMSQLIAPIEIQGRRVLLNRCKHLTYSPLPHLLVGRDESLYRELLSIAELKGSYGKVLVGDPNAGNWFALAKLALAAGHSHTEISHAVDSDGYSWSGGLSNYYQQWVERFAKLREHADPDMQRIADEGLKWSTAQRNIERKSERRKEIHGFD